MHRLIAWSISHHFIAWLILATFWIIIAVVAGRDIVNAIQTINNSKGTKLQRREAKKETWKLAAGLLFSFGGVAILWYMLWYSRHSKELLEHIVARLGTRARTAAGIVAAVLGGLAYWFKRVDQYRYGMVEVAFGVVAGSVATAYIGVGNFYSAIATYVGCIYVISRGCSNVADGYAVEKARRERRSTRDLLDSLRS